MQLANPKAFRPFMTDKVVIRLSSTRTDVDCISVDATVVKGNPYAQNIGNASAGEQWTVTLVEADVKSPAKITKGNVIEEDKLSCKWPRLTVQGVFPLGGLINLLCSAKERGVM